MTTERELKMIADADIVLPDLRGVSPGVVCGSPSMQEMTAEYYDTPTLSLSRWGASLRWRDERPKPLWTVKLPGTSEDSIVSRHEINFAGSRAVVPPRAAELIRVFRRGQPLETVATLRTTRTETPLLVDNAVIATVCDDVVRGDRSDGETIAFREVEVELAAGNEADATLRAITRRLQKAGCEIEDPVLAKVARVLGDAARRPPDVVAARVSSRPTVGDLVSSALSASLDQLIRRDPLVRSRNEPEDLHQFRVAARRLRSDLGTFAPLLDPLWARPLRDELRWLGNETGTVRDADVLRIRLEGRFAVLPASDAAAASLLLSRLERARSRGRTRLLHSMSTERYDSLIDALVSATSNPQFAADDRKVASRQARRVVVELVRKRWRRLKQAADGLEADSPDEDLHEVRILAKRCRYAAEAAAGVFGRDARRFSRAVAEIQEVLGDHQDTVVAEAWLHGAAKAVPTAGVLAGLAIADERAERLEHRRNFEGVWAAARDPELRAWLK